MRIIVSFLLGFITAFYLTDFLTRLFKKPFSSFFGLSTLILGWIVTFFGSAYMDASYAVLLGIFLVGAGAGLMVYHLLSQQFVFSKDKEQRFIRRHEKGVERL